MQASLTGESLRRSYPVRRNRKGRIRRRNRICTRITPHNLAGFVFDFQSQWGGCVRTNIVIDHGPIRWVFTGGFVGRQRGVGVGVPANAPRGLRAKEHSRRLDCRLLQLPQWRDVVENQESAPVSRDAKIVILDDQIANRTGAHVKPQRLPVIPVIKRYVYGALSSGKQQTFSFGILAHNIGVFVIWNTTGNFAPGCSSVTSSINVWPEIVKPQRVDSRIGSVLVEMAGFEN